MATGITDKLMSITEAEFRQTLARLDTAHLEPAEREFHFNLGEGNAIVTFEAVKGVTLGRLLALPRARVRISFQGVSEAAKAAFLKDFDMTFQRGGG